MISYSDNDKFSFSYSNELWGWSTNFELTGSKDLTHKNCGYRIDVGDNPHPLLLVPIIIEHWEECGKK